MALRPASFRLRPRASRRPSIMGTASVSTTQRRVLKVAVQKTGSAVNMRT
jgi:hypothetical protein